MKRTQEKHIENNLEAASMTPNRAFIAYPSFNPLENLTNWQMVRIWQRARALFDNFPEIRHAVQTLNTLTGTITPRPASDNEEWNNEARNAFLNRVNNPYLFDVQGVLNWQGAQSWIEKRAVIDGDCLTLLKTAKDGGASFSFYAAPQITSDGHYNKGRREGIEYADNGLLRGYRVFDYTTRQSAFVAQNRAILYRHNPDPADPRGQSELIPAIATAEDLLEINGYHKSSIKFASLFGLVETVDANAPKQGLSDLAKLNRNGNKESTENNNVLPVSVGGSKAITLTAGHKLETIHDNRPSNEVREFCKMMINSLAYSVGLDPELLFNASSMGSASARFVLAKAKDWAKERLNDRIIWANKIYQYVLSCEVRAGRLRPCPADNWNAVKWINSAKWSIDLQRDANNALNLVQAGLMSADDFTLAQYGKTSEEIFNENLHSYSHNRERAEKAGYSYFDICPPRVGATYTGEEEAKQHTKEEQTTDDDGLQND